MASLAVAELNARGLACKVAGRYEEGRDHYRRALALLEAQRRPDRDAFATIYHNLGGIEHARGDYAAAEVYARRGLALREALPVGDPLAVAADRVALAAILDGERRFAESEPLYRRALRVLRSRGAPAHDLAAALNNLGTMYVLTGRLARGRALLEEAAERKRQALGPSHPSLAVTLNNLAVALRRQGEVVRSAGLHAKAATILGSVLRSDHPTTVTCRANAARAAADIPA
jgi:tetratricopeptide (TPR) repeat protein